MRCETCHRDAPEDAVFCPYCAGRLHDVIAEPAAFEYAAFISYRHLPRDQDVAKRVQQAIETYKLPRGASPEAGGTRLGKCFRDEDELAAAHSLPDRILDALSKSSALVVVCTPDTAESAWVRREVEAFVEMRGHERVFAVLADGSSEESIPQYLKVSTTSIDNEAATTSNPLAADMRSTVRSKTREETLRLIAAIANCGFDDLKQRDRARRRKRNTIVAVAAILVVAAIATALAFAYSARQDALVTESRKLATESEQLLSQGDRYGALEKALAALPQSESSSDRPYLPEARAALENALQIEFDENHPWNLRYTIEMGSEIEKIRISPDEGWFAVIDSDLVLAFHDISTGKKLSEVRLLSLIEGEPSEKDLDPNEWSLTPAGSRLIVWERDGSCVLCCIEAESGNVTWKYNDMTNALSVSDDGEIATLFCHSGNSFFVAAIHIPTGEWWGARQFSNPGIPHYTRELPSCMGDMAATLYVGFNNLISRYDILENTESYASIQDSAGVYSIARAGETTITLSSTLLDVNKTATGQGQAEFTISALDDDMQTAWSNSGSWSATTVNSQRGFVGVQQDPLAEKIMMVGEPAVVALAGSSVRVISIGDGRTIYEESFDSPIVGADPLGFEADDSVLYITCADGTVYSRHFDNQSSIGGPTAFSYPGPVDNAHLDFYSHKGFFALARSLDEPRRMFAVQAETRTANDVIPASDYTLDELIKMAHSELDAAAQ